MWLLYITFAIIAIYLYLKYLYSYWQRKNFPYVKPSIFGNLGPVVTLKKSFGITIYDLHRTVKAPFIGIYLFCRPAVLVRDAELIKKILTTDFHSFHDRGIYNNPKCDPLSNNLFAISGQKWTNLRAKLAPAFSSGKLKNMMSTIMIEGDKLQKYLEPFAENAEIVAMKDLFARFTLDIISSVTFGLEVNTVENPNHELRLLEMEHDNPSIIKKVRGVGKFLCPKLLHIIRIPFTPVPIRRFLIDIVRNNIKYREENNISRKDLMQFLIQLRNTGGINTDDSNWDVKMVSEQLKLLTIEECAAQIFVFYIAGYETTSSALAYSFFELAKNRKILKKVQQEIDDTLKKYNNEITYECLQDLTYTELCIKEIIRKYPALPILNRFCTHDYKIPDTDLTIEKGTAVVISLLGILRDPKYFTEPDAFIPERYLSGSQLYNPAAYIPFGDGPRGCIAVRLGKLVVKIGLIKLLQKYEFESLDNNEIEFNPFGETLKPKGGVQLKISYRKFD